MNFFTGLFTGGISFLNWLLDFGQGFAFDVAEKLGPILVSFLPPGMAAHVTAGWTQILNGFKFLDVVLPLFFMIQLFFIINFAVLIIKVVRRFSAFIPFIGQGMSRV